MKTSRLLLGMLAMASLTTAGVAAADEPGNGAYLTDSSGKVVKSGTGLCWRTGAWTPAMATAECDPDLVKKEAPKVAAAEPPAPVPAPAVAQDAPAFVPITLQAEALFGFDKAVIRPGGKQKLDEEVVAKMKEYPQVEQVRVTGYTDRIGSSVYNQKLSQRRADAVKDYLVGQGVAAGRIETAAKGEADPVVSCAKVKGKANGKNRKLVECLQPNRRIMVEIETQRPVQR